MRTRRLGKSELEVPVVILGAWAIGGWNWGGSDDDEAVRVLHAAIDAGMNAIDTAPVYGFGRSERVVGRAIADRRDRVLVLTKIGLRWDDPRGEFFFQTEDEDGRMLRVHRNLRPWSVQQEVEKSLKRLGTDRIDLIQVHWPDPQTPIAETMGVLLQMKTAGKVRAIGVSNFAPKMLDDTIDALGEVPLASTQPRYSLVHREIEKDVLPYCVKNDVGVIAYSPLEQGLLTGKVTAERTFAEKDGRAKRPTFTAENRRRVNEVLDRVVRPIAERHGATLGQVALAWLLGQEGVTSVIAGARTIEQVHENAGAAAVELSAEELASIRTAFEALQLEGVSRGPLWKRVVRKLLGR
jgi:aryl-alcohol dehydrogenase-like predicted oxidoreductase